MIRCRAVPHPVPDSDPTFSTFQDNGAVTLIWTGFEGARWKWKCRGRATSIAVDTEGVDFRGPLASRVAGARGKNRHNIIRALFAPFISIFIITHHNIFLSPVPAASAPSSGCSGEISAPLLTTTNSADQLQLRQPTAIFLPETLTPSPNTERSRTRLSRVTSWPRRSWTPRPRTPNEALCKQRKLPVYIINARPVSKHAKDRAPRQTQKATPARPTRVLSGSCDLHGYCNRFFKQTAQLLYFVNAKPVSKHANTISLGQLQSALRAEMIARLHCHYQNRALGLSNTTLETERIASLHCQCEAGRQADPRRPGCAAREDRRSSSPTQNRPESTPMTQEDVAPQAQRTARLRCQDKTCHQARRRSKTTGLPSHTFRIGRHFNSNVVEDGCQTTGEAHIRGQFIKEANLGGVCTRGQFIKDANLGEAYSREQFIREADLPDPLAVHQRSRSCRMDVEMSGNIRGQFIKEADLANPWAVHRRSRTHTCGQFINAWFRSWRRTHPWAGHQRSGSRRQIHQRAVHQGSRLCRMGVEMAGDVDIRGQFIKEEHVTEWGMAVVWSIVLRYGLLCTEIVITPLVEFHVVLVGAEGGGVVVVIFEHAYPGVKAIKAASWGPSSPSLSHRDLRLAIYPSGYCLASNISAVISESCASARLSACSIKS
ncbi:hypothetical protein M409DRAFT_60312 [Zasmidium cellare ATCC 36951]|uniref:Uncharacterized protein n=1 Tax=Zasmidium cellare ATCC 36951 TaxID=1080233 RepID=A0A6A6BZ29_ZASCE|nr:uncharacterized protein M409DRAFT_60312 [Zasmidium cellare ATCC 36951]KAF2160057.1 hypothetical protein M409DRAFT_60312 [Zasmidium cellare ATCC 36951]